MKRRKRLPPYPLGGTIEEIREWSKDFFSRFPRKAKEVEKSEN